MDLAAQFLDLAHDCDPVAGFGERWHIGSTSRGFSFQTLQCMAPLPPRPPLDADTNVLPAVIVAGRRFLSVGARARRGMRLVGSGYLCCARAVGHAAGRRVTWGNAGGEGGGLFPGSQSGWGGAGRSDRDQVAAVACTRFGRPGDAAACRVVGDRSFRFTGDRAA